MTTVKKKKKMKERNWRNNKTETKINEKLKLTYEHYLVILPWS